MQMVNTVNERNAVECDVDTHTSLAHPAPSPSALEMLIARDRLGHLSSSKCSRRDGSRRRSLGIQWRETGGPRTGKRQGECTEGEKDGV